MTYLINQLQERLIDQDLSINGLERKAGVKRGVIQNILYGRSKNPRFEVIQAIAQALGCTVNDLTQDQINTDNSQPHEKNSQDDPYLHWDSSLYKKCFDRVEFFMNQVGKKLTNPEVLDYVNEVYQYTLEQQRSIPDDTFIKWLLKKPSVNNR